MIYTIFCFLAVILASPFLILASFLPKFRRSVPARFFLFKNPPPKQAKFHIHACSFGEVSAVEKLAKSLGDARISVITQTGFNRATEFSGENFYSENSGDISNGILNKNPTTQKIAQSQNFNNVRFLPFECFLPFWLTKCDTLIVFEAEIWLNLFKIAKKKGARTILLNARISDRSYRSYLRFKFYYRAVFSCVDLVLAQSQKDKIRLENLGAKNVKIIGNFKSVLIAKATKNYPKNFARLIIIASSHEGEERGILEFLKLAPNDQLIIAPRHPERLKKVEILAQNFATKNGLFFEKFSQNLGLKSPVILLDALGELVNFYKICDIVLLCGSFEKNIGGHNPFEAAQFNPAIISGKFAFNQCVLYENTQNIYECDYAEIPALLSQNLEKSKIKNRADFNEILAQIKGEK